MSKVLDGQIERLNRLLNRSTKGYISNNAGFRAEPGHFKLDSYKPGPQRWYKLAVIINEGGGEHNISQNYTANEMSAYLSGALDVLQAQQDSVRFGTPTDFTKY